MLRSLQTYLLLLFPAAAIQPAYYVLYPFLFPWEMSINDVPCFLAIFDHVLLILGAILEPEVIIGRSLMLILATA